MVHYSRSLFLIVSFVGSAEMVAPTLIPGFGLSESVSLQFPESDTVCVPACELSVTARLAEAALPLDLNMTEIVQLLPAASEPDELGQVFVCVKLLVFMPVKPMLAMINGVVPVLVRVAVCAELLLPELTVPKFKLPGVRVAVAYTAATGGSTTCGAAE